MGKDLKGKEIGDGIYQQPNGTYCARFVDKFGRRKSKRSKKLQEVRQWIADATYIDQHSDFLQIRRKLLLLMFRRNSWKLWWATAMRISIALFCRQVFVLENL